MLRRPTPLALLALLIASSTAVTAQPTADSVALREYVEAYRDVWNTHDPTALAEFFSDDADLVMGNQPGVRGREEIRGWWQAYFARQEPERRLTLDVRSVRVVAADVAVVNVTTTTGGRDRQGKDLVMRQFRGAWVVHRQRGTWLISAMRGLPTEEDRVELTRSLETTASLKSHIRAFVRAYEDAFDTHDAAAISAFYTDDADIMVRNAPVIHGRLAILNWWRAYFSRLRPQSTDRSSWYESMQAVLIIDEIRMMAPDVALINITGTAAPRQGDAEATPLRYARATWVVVREEGEWLIAALWVLPSEEDRIIRSQLDVAQPFERYARASQEHDLATLEALTADDIVWQLGPYTLEGKKEALGPNAYDAGAEMTLIYRNVRVQGNVVEFGLIETNKVIRAVGMTEVRHYPRFEFENGLVVRKSSGWREPPAAYSMAEFNRRMAPLRKWIRETHPEALSKLLDADGNFVFSQDNGALMLRLTRAWVAAGAPGRLPGE